MKKIMILAFLIGSAFLVSAQLVLSSGSQIVVASNSHLVVSSVNNSSGTIDNDGTVSITGNVDNDGTGLFDSGSGGTVIFSGSSAQEITGDHDIEFYGTVEINNSAGVSIKTSDGHNQTINGTLAFTNGLFTLNEFDLNIGSTDPTGVGAAKYIATNGDGQVKRTVAASNILFPVGNSAYNPITLNNAGTSDTYGVKAVEDKPASFTGTTHIVNESWDVTEAVAGGSNLTVTPQWNSGDEANGFDRAKSTIGLTTDAGANVTWGSIGAATGSDPYTKSLDGITSVGTFMVADDYYKGYNLNLKLWLAGPYNATNDDMDNDLNTAGGTLLIPTTDPYEGTTTVSSIHADIVDWVKIELRASNRTTVRKTYHAFVNTSGAIVDYNNSPFFAKEVDFSLTDYSIAIIHRNHFGVASSSNDINLRTTAGTDFTQLANVYDDATISYPLLPLQLLEAGVYGLWTGDVNSDGKIVYNESNSDREVILTAVGGSSTMTNIVTNQYSASDLNLDRNVVYNESNSDRELILTNVGGSSTMTRIANTHLPD